MTLSVTIERFFAIAYPLLNMELKNLLIYSSVGAAIIYNIPRFFELTTIGSLVYDEELKRNVTVMTSIYLAIAAFFNTVYLFSFTALLLWPH